MSPSRENWVHRCLVPSTSGASQAISAFCVGVLLAPTSWGALLFIVGLTVYEVVVWLSYPCGSYDLGTRAIIVLASIIGWFVGRWVAGKSHL